MPLSPEQFSEIVGKLPEIRSQRMELQELARAKPQKVQEIFGGDLTWANIYELSYNQQIASLLVLLNIHTYFIDAAESHDYLGSVLRISKESGELDQWYEANEATINKKHLLWMAMVLQRNVLSIMLYHQSLGSLVEDVRTGIDESFFKAVSIDRTILSCPTFANRLSQAEFLGDKQFFIRLRKALKGPSLKHMQTICDVRYGIVLLREAGFDTFTDDQLIQFFISNGLYPNSYNASKNLRKHIYEAKKFART